MRIEGRLDFARKGRGSTGIESSFAGVRFWDDAEGFYFGVLGLRSSNAFLDLLRGGK